MARNKKELLKNINIRPATIIEMEIKINRNKTKAMVIGENTKVINVNINVDRERTEQNKYFQYLATIIDGSRTQEADIKKNYSCTLKINIMKVVILRDIS